MIDLCTLGTGGTMPLPSRALASLYVRCGGRALLVDCGEGTQVEIDRLGWGYARLEALLITHFHADHCSGLPGFLLALAKAGRQEPFHIWGPAGLPQVVAGLRVIAPVLPYELVLHEFGGQGCAFEGAGLSVRAFPLEHGVPCFGFSFTLPRAPVFLPEKARALGIPVRLWGALQRGEQAEGWLPAMVLGPERPGIRFVYATDTRPCPALTQAGEGSALMILEGMYASGEDLPKALKNGHMLFSESAALARDAGAARLLLTHFSPSLSDPDACVALAQSVFPASACAHDGEVFTLRFRDAEEAPRP